MNLIFLDNNATTPLDPRVFASMLPFLTTEFGNPSSMHVLGCRAAAGVDRARCQVASLLGAHQSEIFFTSGATESCNFAIKGIVAAGSTGHIVTSSVEHPAVLESCRALERSGVSVTYVRPRTDGIVATEDVVKAIRPNTNFISIMLVNNEIGTINPVAEIGKIARDKNIIFHCDATQGIGKIPFDVISNYADLVSLSGHKFYGPKGTGALFIRRGLEKRILPLIDGGGQELGMRSGTPNVANLVGLGKASEIAQQEMEKDHEHILTLRDRLLKLLKKYFPTLKVNGSLKHRVAGNLSITFEGVETEDLLLKLGSSICVSASSACKSSSLQPSYVLQEIGLSGEEINSTVRFGIGRFNSEAEIDIAVDLLNFNIKYMSI